MWQMFTVSKCSKMENNDDFKLYFLDIAASTIEIEFRTMLDMLTNIHLDEVM